MNQRCERKTISPNSTVLKTETKIAHNSLLLGGIREVAKKVKPTTKVAKIANRNNAVKQAV
jgi:hypothetical protein